MDRKELLDYGKEIRTTYGIAKEFEWKVIDYKKRDIKFLCLVMRL